MMMSPMDMMNTVMLHISLMQMQVIILKMHQVKPAARVVTLETMIYVMIMFVPVLSYMNVLFSYKLSL